MRVFPRLLYGAGHAYSQPLSGSGSEATLNALSLDGLRAFHDTWFRPDNATLIVVGDVTLAELEPALEARFAGWEPGEAPARTSARSITRPGPSSTSSTVPTPSSRSSSPATSPRPGATPATCRSRR